ncbi:beta strand repeat-containing protein [Hymenobacter coccineus]|uniref:PKD domain-containing protein n=1 Tax=Hymenobacter coccineus TaxID=1908235 RepID=A0A1G1SQ90_9BACT|nr:PKD domain-containing protein [Hymenobacter coccineus]OGX80787.1 hypothetical protein BEN49_03505 [Hymenobacter coccineus]
MQKGAAAIVLLATGTDGTNASGFDLYLDFTGTTAGTISLDWAELNNGTGNRQSTFKLQTNTGGPGGFVDLAGSTVVVTNNEVSAGRLTVALPAALTGSLAKVRFYLAATAGGTAPTGSRPRFSIDNLEVTAGAAVPAPTTSLSTGSVAPTSFCVAPAAGSPSFDVPFTGTGTFTGTYKVQLSDASGIFAASTTTGIIGTGGASPIAAAIPAGTASGTGYRVRVLNDGPATYGTNNGADLTVSLTAASVAVSVTPAGPQTVAAAGTGAALTASAPAGATFAWQYGTSAAGPYSTAVATGATYQVRGADFPGAGTYYLVAQATATTTCGATTGTSDPIAVTVSAPAATPTLSVSLTTLPDFGNVAAGAASLPKSFVVGGDALTGPITVTPPAGFEIRTGATAFACCAIVLTPVGGSVPATTIDVRFVPTGAQTYQATVPVTSPGLPGQAVAVSGTGVGTVYPATLGTAAITDLASTTATTGGTVADDGGSPVIARGVVWAKTANPTLSASKTSDGTGTGAFTSALTGLLPGTTYFVRAYATNGTSTAYGDELAFTTVAVPLAAEPTAPAALAAGQVTSTSVELTLSGGDGTKRLVVARLGGDVNAVPADATTYAADPAFSKGSVLGTGNYVVYNGTGTSVTVTGLRPNTSYSFAVFAFNDNDTPYAENYLTTAPGTLAQATQAIPAALLLEENFEYPAGALLTANNWTAHSGAGTKAVAVTTPGLSAAGYGPNSGNAASLTGSGEDVNRQFDAVYARTPVYVSFLVNVANASATADYFFHLGPKSIGTTFRAKVYIRKNTATNKVAFGVVSGSGATVFTTDEYALNTTHLLVLKHVFDEAGNTTQLFLNPATDTEPTTATATATETGTTPAAPNDNIGAVALRQGANSPTLTVDGIRVGTSYRVVKTGLVCLPPAPSFTAAPVCAGAPTAFVDASTGLEANATYAWDVDGDGTTDATTKGPLAYTYAAPGVYTATLTIAQGACSESYTQQVTVQALPTATLSGDAAVCAGSSATLAIRLTGTAPWTVNYSADGGTTSTALAVAAAAVDAEGVYHLTVTPAATTTYSLTSVVDGNCTGTAPAGTTTVTVNTAPVVAVPTVPVATTTADQCGATVAFAATATGAPAPAIVYSVVQGGVATAITSPYFFPVGTTVVTATATNGCGTDAKTFAVTVQDKQAPTVVVRNLTVNLANGTVAITPAQVDNGSTDACGIASLALSKTTFSCANIGANTLTLTVTDIHGNTASQTATVTVMGTVPTPTIAVKPASAVYTGGVATNLYLGYGPQSATLAATGGVSYRWAPATGLSSSTAANPVFTATAAGTFTYTVTATSASGCTGTATVTLTVTDVRCGNKNDKVTVCHKGNALCVSSGDVADYLAHGDQLGNCSAKGGKATAAAGALLAGGIVAPEAIVPVFEAHPNPFTTRAVVHFRAASTGPAQLLLYNSLGQLVKTLYNGTAQAGQDYEVAVDGADLVTGLYTGRLLVDGKAQALRLMLSK